MPVSPVIACLEELEECSCWLTLYHALGIFSPWKCKVDWIRNSAKYVLCVRNPSLWIAGIGDFSLNTCNNLGPSQHKQAWHFRGSPDTHSLSVLPTSFHPCGYQEMHSPLENIPACDLEAWQGRREIQRWSGWVTRPDDSPRVCRLWCQRRGLPSGNSQELQSPPRSGPLMGQHQDQHCNSLQIQN